MTPKGLDELETLSPAELDEAISEARRRIEAEYAAIARAEELLAKWASGGGAACER